MALQLSPVIAGGGSESSQVLGPLSATDNAVARFDGTSGKLLQNSLATLADNGDFLTPGHFAFGNQSTIGDVNYLNQFNSTFIPVTGTYYSYWTLFTDINPATDYNNPVTDFITFFDFETLILTTTKNLGLLNNFYNYIEVGGSGTVDEVICAQYGAVITGTRSCGENYALLLGTGHFGTAGTITEDVTLAIQSPSHAVGTTMTSHIGIEIENQAFGTTSRAIKTHGGIIEFGADTGINTSLYFTDADLSQPFTAGFPSNLYGRITSISNSGTLSIYGLSSASTSSGIFMGGYIGTSGATAFPSVQIDTGKSDGGTGFASMGNTETCFALSNNTSFILTVKGNGNTTVTGSLTSAGLSESGLITWTAGAAITAGSYQWGRDADGTNQMHGNVPAGASYEFSINDVAKMTLASDGSLSVPGSGGSSERFGSGSNATNTACLAIGNIAQATGSMAIAIGFNTTATGTQCIAIGNSASATGTAGAANSIAIGQSASTGFDSVIVLGTSSAGTAANQFVLGSASTIITDMYLGKGVTSLAPTTITIHATGGGMVGTNGGDLALAGGFGAAASDTGGSILFKTAPLNSATTLSTRMAITPAGNIGIGTTSAGASMTNGFSILSGVAPSGNVTDAFQFYSADQTAGNAAPHFRTENGDVVKLFKSAAYTITNVTTDRAYDANSTTLDEIADVLGTLIADMQLTGIIG